MTETVTSADGTTIAYDRTGEGPGLILLGGALSTRQSAAGFAARLADAFTVIAVDRRGRGDSTDAAAAPTAGGYALADTSDREAAIGREVDDVRALVDLLGGSAMIYGHSSGAALAMEAAAVIPGITRVTAYEPPYTTTSAVGPIRSALEAGDRDTAARLFLTAVGADPDAAAGQPWWPGIVATAQTLPYEYALTDGGVPDRLETIGARVLVLVGGDSAPWAHDAVTETADRIPGAVARVVPGQTHNAAEDVLAPILREFFVSA